jgi:murein DD-endopeptidase MepM/ murein hydrolase activator NlpD
MGNKTDMSIGPALYLGRVGSTGTSTGPHAHWEVLKDGKRFPLSKARSDIGQYLQFRLPKQETWQTLYSKQGDNFALNPAATLTSPMGMRKHPVHGDMRMHGGEDYGLPEGTQLRFLGPGSVATHRNQGGAGNVSSLRTGPYELQTFHLSELPEASIAKGERSIPGATQGSSGDFQGLLSGYLLGSLLRGEPKEDPKTQMMRGFVKNLMQPQQNDMAGALFQQLLSSSVGGVLG